MEIKTAGAIPLWLSAPLTRVRVYKLPSPNTGGLF
jgi:hypothetical protein